MSLRTLPALVSAIVAKLAACHDRRTRERFGSVIFGMMICREKRQLRFRREILHF